ncbi:MAG: histidinol-phosphatase [Frankiaceae bacterium]|nr:histidinol-phosphatase [Frankiaceae bacterium]MBV9369326.1 histidinol-phosphatase [Frankiales bacterium]
MARFLAADLLVETKPDLTPVTDADRAIEDALRRTLAAERPDDAVVGEEAGTTGAGPRTWIVDPIDGTKNFVRGVPVWATLIALQAHGDVVVGVVSAPALQRRWWAARGDGAWTQGPHGPRRLAVSRVSNLGDAFVSYSSLNGWGTRGILDLCDRAWRTRAFGDFWSHVLVAEGAVDVSCEPEVSLWDLAALQPIVEEAGGRFSDLSRLGRPDGGSVVCTNGLLHDEVLRTLTAPAHPGD